MTKYIDRYYLNWEEYGIKFGGWWRQPWANTIAYYPLTSTTTVNDMSWNSKTLTNYSSVSFGTQGWVDCATFNGSNYLEISSQTLNLTEFTMSCWVRWTNANTRGFLWIWKFNTPYQCMAMLKETGGLDIDKMMISPYADAAYSSSATVSNTWYNVIGIYTNGKYTTYLNSQEWGSRSYNINISWNSNVLRVWYAATGEPKMYWQLSNVIFEDKARTAQEISDYYDQTKSLYGIS